VVVSGHPEGRPIPNSFQDFRQVFLGQCEINGDWLQLNDNNPVNITRLDIIACVDLPQPNSPRYRRDDVAIGEVEFCASICGWSAFTVASVPTPTLDALD
jgi:hypothetical protein